MSVQPGCVFAGSYTETVPTGICAGSAPVVNVVVPSTVPLAPVESTRSWYVVCARMPITSTSCSVTLSGPSISQVSSSVPNRTTDDDGSAVVQRTNAESTFRGFASTSLSEIVPTTALLPALPPSEGAPASLPPAPPLTPPAPAPAFSAPAAPPEAAPPAVAAAPTPAPPPLLAAPTPPPPEGPLPAPPPIPDT